MLSLYAITTPQGMTTYYESDGYYARDDAQKTSAWHGEGADAAGLRGEVRPEDFQRVLDGETPEGRRLGRMVEGEWKHRAGVDLTFSAPKSVSVMALVAGDQRLVEAHERAVKSALDHVEEKVLETRVWDAAAGAQVKERDLDMVAALFRHEVNRNQDPHLHTHAVVANMARASDGKWRSIEGAGLFHHKMEVGARYRAELAMNLRELGYEVERTHMDGRFEIKGVSDAALEGFSTRSKEIRDALKDYDHPNAKTAALATLMTRDHKRPADRDALLAQWRARGEELGLDPALPASGAFSLEQGDEARLARDAVDYAVRHLGERSSTFSLSDLRTTASSHGVGAFRPAALDAAIAAETERGRLIPSRHPEHRDHVTTERAVATERETIAAMQAAQGAVRPFMAFADINRGLKDSVLNDGQKNAVRALLSGTDRVIGVQGYAGVGKTTLLDAARELAEGGGYRLIGLAPSASAAKTLGEEAGIASMTLQKFLGRYEGYAQGRGTAEGKRAVRAEYRNTLIVVDESSLAGTEQMRSLMRIASEILPARVVLVGDAKQLDAVDAGKPFAQLQSPNIKGGGMRTLKVDEIVRQKNPDLKDAVHAAIAGDIKRAFERIGANILEAAHPEKPSAEARDRALAEKAFEAWKALPEYIRDSSGVAAPTHGIRERINALVRDERARQGKLSGPELEVPALKSAGYTTAERGRVENYFPGDTVIFNRDTDTARQGEVLTVLGRNAAANTVALKNAAGDPILWSPQGRRGANAIDVLKTGSVTLRQGDKIRFTRNDESLGVVNSGIADVVGIDASGAVTLRKEDGGALTLDRDAPALRFIDHAWASTTHAFQGRTVDHIIGVMHADHPHLTHQKAFYVEISRARHGATLITVDRERLAETLETRTGERIAALEAIDKEPETAPEKETEPEFGK